MTGPGQPQTCSHLINARTLTGVFQAVRMFSPCRSTSCIHAVLDACVHDFIHSLSQTFSAGHCKALIIKY